MKKQTFRGWLLAQRRRQDPVGDLARDLKEDREFRGRTVGSLRERMIDLGACDLAMVALERAAVEYSQTQGEVTQT